MANAVVARIQGDDYQARFFWLTACRLFEDYSKVIRVGYDMDGSGAPKAFDDVVAFYSVPVPDGRGGTVSADYYQVKFHVNHAGAFTCAALTDPAFIGASAVSFLQRLKAAQEQYAPCGLGARFLIVSPWQISPDDPLAKLVHQTTGEIRLEVLFDGTGPGSAMGRIRTSWCDHLQLSTDDQLKQVLMPLRIRAGAGDLCDVQDRLNDKLQNAGLRPVPADAHVHPYDDLIRKVRADSTAEFTRAELQAICVTNGLWTGVRLKEEPAVQVGLRSFLRWAEHMEDETEHMLCLSDHFDGRPIKDTALWHQGVFPKLSGFLTETMRPQCAYHLHVDAHSSIAFAAGYCLDTKSGANIIPVQKTRRGRLVWDPALRDPNASYTDWQLEELRINESGTDVALAICATHDVVQDVRLYAEGELPGVKRMLVCKTTPLPATSAIADGAHAYDLAQSLSTLLKTTRSVQERQAHLHIFAAAPNALMFFLGQHARSFGRFTLYEFDFDSGVPGAYQPSLSFPPLSSAQPCAPAISLTESRQQ